MAGCGKGYAKRVLRTFRLPDHFRAFLHLNDAPLQTWSITPRLERQERDLRDSLAGPDRHRLLRRDVPPGPRRVQGLAPTHIYDLSQQTLAGYWQHTLGLLPTTDFSYGARVQTPA
jgi:iron complex outermembrane receptor protein